MRNDFIISSDFFQFCIFDINCEPRSVKKTKDSTNLLTIDNRSRAVPRKKIVLPPLNNQIESNEWFPENKVRTNTELKSILKKPSEKLAANPQARIHDHSNRF